MSLANYGQGALPDPSTIDPALINRWIVPDADPKLRRYYKHIDGEWVRFPAELAVIELETHVQQLETASPGGGNTLLTTDW